MAMRIAVLICSVLITWSLDGQELKIGGGGNFAIPMVSLPSAASFDTEARPGYQFGVFAEFPIAGPVAFSTGVQYTHNTYRFSMTSRDITFVPITLTNDFSIENLHLPLLVRVYLGDGDFRLFAEGGGFVGLHMRATRDYRFNSAFGNFSGSETLSIGERDVDHLQSFDFGLSAGVGLRYRRFECATRYDHGLANVMGAGAEDGAEVFTRRLTVSLSYALLSR